MDIVKIQKKDHANMIIGCDWGIAQELSDYFSFFVPGYKFMPLYKNKVWDGKIRLFNVNNCELSCGLISYVKDFCEKRNYQLEYEESQFGLPESYNEINPNDIMNFIKNLNLKSKGESISIRDYQFNAICEGLKRKRSILLSPTGSGKSLILYCLSKYWLQMLTDGWKYPRAGRVLIIVPTTSLVEQMYGDFIDYGQKPEGMHKIYSGKDKDFESAICISTWQSIYKMPAAWFDQFGMVLGDECHGFKSKSLTNIMNKCRLAEYRFGTTGTLDGTQTHQLVLEGLFGKVMKVTTTKTLQDNQTLADLEIFMIQLQYSEEIKKQIVGLQYQDEIDYIVKYEQRNKFIRNLALDQKGNTLVLFQFVEKHGKPLFDLINTKAKEGRKVFFVSGATETSDREAIRKITEGQKDAIIVASLGTFSTGINIRNLHNIIFASPSKSQIKVLQSIGRGLRKSEDGRTTQLFDIADDLHWKSRKNYALVHAEERLRIYKNEKFKCNVYKVKM